MPPPGHELRSGDPVALGVDMGVSSSYSVVSVVGTGTPVGTVLPSPSGGQGQVDHGGLLITNQLDLEVRETVRTLIIERLRVLGYRAADPTMVSDLIEMLMGILTDWPEDMPYDNRIRSAQEVLTVLSRYEPPPPRQNVTVSTPERTHNFTVPKMKPELSRLSPKTEEPEPQKKKSVWEWLRNPAV